MNKKSPIKFKLWCEKYRKNKITLILANGFEVRAKSILLDLAENTDLILSKVIAIDYKTPSFNEPIRSEIISILDKSDVEYRILPDSDLDSLIQNIQPVDTKIVVDISAMSRVMIFTVLHKLFDHNIPFNVAYTEAESYYPDYSFYEQLKNAKPEHLFDMYEQIEKSEVIYSYDCRVIQPKEFKGLPEPGRPAVLIGFLTFKRSRLQAVLRQLEFQTRILIIGKPVREDLRWRQELMELVNTDILSRRPSTKLYLETLNPFTTIDSIEKEINENPDCKKANIYLAPLGSKMQTLGSYLLWRKYPHMTIIFSQPEKYFKGQFSEKSRDSFLVLHEDMITEG